MHVDVSSRSGSLVLKVHGDLGLATAALLDEQMRQAQSSDATRIVVELDDDGFIDSSGLHLLLRHAERCSQDGDRLRLTRGSEQAQCLFAISGLIDCLPFLKT